MDDINGMMKYGAVNRYGNLKYYSRRKRNKRKSPTKPLDNVIINDGVNQQDGKQNSVHALDNVKQPSLMIMFNGSSKPFWSGIFKINSEACLEVDAHLSGKACNKVQECSISLQPVLEVVKLPRLQVWPKGWEPSGPIVSCIGLYFFPSNSRSNEGSDELLNEVIKTDSALKVTAAIADLLIFPSVVLPEQNQLYNGKHYLWGLFRRRNDISDEVVLGGEQNGSTCVVPVDEGGQQTQHLLNQVDEEQPASSEEITCAMNDSHGENPPLVESTCEAQIDEAMDSDMVVLGGEQNGSACVVPVDEGGQQAQHILNQADEAQTASSQQIICAMNDSHVENPSLVENTCEAQIDEAMDSDIVVQGGEQNGSACVMPIDEGEQQAQYILNQVDEAQTASSKQIICAMNDSHVENPPLVESTCEAQIDEAMETVTGECLMTLPGSSLSGTKQPNSPKAVSNSSVHHPEEVSKPGDSFTSSTKPKASSSVATQLAEKTGHGQSCSDSESRTAEMVKVLWWSQSQSAGDCPGHSYSKQMRCLNPRAQELIQDVATEGAVSVPAEMVTTDFVSGNSPAVGAGLNPGTDHQQHFEGEPPQPDMEPSQACLELFPVRAEQMGLAAPGAGTSNIMEVDLELSLGMPLVLHM